MKALQKVVSSSSDLSKAVDEMKSFEPDLLLCFGSASYFSSPSGGESVDSLKKVNAKVALGCSTAGEISGKRVLDKSLSVTGMKFSNSKMKSASEKINGIEDSLACGQRLGKSLAAPDLKGVLVFGPGLDINGSALIEGIKSVVPAKTVVAGGLAGDGGEFKKTFTMHQGSVQSNAVVAVAWYGDTVEFSSSSRGGWKPFGPNRIVTKAQGTKLFELDGEKALDVYKVYLKEFAADLPRSGLLFPFAVIDEHDQHTGVIRTILAVDEKEGSLTLAGAMSTGQTVRLMHASNDGLVSGAEAAAKDVGGTKDQNGVNVLVSCVGRKLVLGEEADDEVAAVTSILPNRVTTGFYSYGEIGPFRSKDDCQLHNQTMTVISINEKG